MSEHKQLTVSSQRQREDTSGTWSIFYSYRKESTGLAAAALMV